ncbi:MAG TPA: hypothetical protein PK397_04415 [Ignavibacteriaceae bacterium]|nr:hypothetical protein [Ignavibacteriaceae bacterium]
MKKLLNMFGFVNSNKEKPQLGGEIYQERIKKQRIAYSILGVVAFVVLNLILYFLATM